MESDRLTIRLGPLAGPLAAYCEQHEISASQLVRRLLAERLGVEEPKLPANGLETLTREQKAAAAKLGGWRNRRNRRS